MCFKLQLHILKHNLGKREQLKPPLPPPNQCPCEDAITITLR